MVSEHAILLYTVRSALCQYQTIDHKALGNDECSIVNIYCSYASSMHLLHHMQLCTCTGQNTCGIIPTQSRQYKALRAGMNCQMSTHYSLNYYAIWTNILCSVFCPQQAKLGQRYGQIRSVKPKGLQPALLALRSDPGYSLVYSCLKF